MQRGLALSPVDETPGQSSQRSSESPAPVLERQQRIAQSPSTSDLAESGEWATQRRPNTDELEWLPPSVATLPIPHRWPQASGLHSGDRLELSKEDAMRLTRMRKPSRPFQVSDEAVDRIVVLLMLVYYTVTLLVALYFYTDTVNTISGAVQYMWQLISFHILGIRIED
ncbi:MAG: hypothetical protein KVP17_003444 [Porospora cf. gigantea B]|uniref:uncharacterized protein n=1 Tax=Porospora cf. gigantea B TaxID=2853592 RepID=UPI00357197B6|nr:MAG: hypothetical protein KVP17_003444 [Porospora cf. gigantea B]